MPLNRPVLTKRKLTATPMPDAKNEAKQSGKKRAKGKGKQGFSSHLLVMRSMVLRIVLVIFAGFLLVFYLLCRPLVDFILQPVLQRGIQVIATRVSESLMMQFKLSLVAALVISMPFTIWEIWRFVGPALYPREKRCFGGF